MSLLAQLFNKNGDKIDPINHHYEKQLSNLKGKILWTNRDIDQNFDAANIAIDLSKYDSYEVIAFSSIGEQLQISTGIINKQYGARLSWNYCATGNNFYNTRTIGISSTGISFGDCRYQVPSTGAEGVANNRCVPLYIIGYNRGLFNS